MSATYPMDMVRGRITVQVFSPFLFLHLPNVCFSCWKLKWWLEVQNTASSNSCKIKWRKKNYVMYIDAFCSLHYLYKLSKFALYLQTEASPYQYRGMFHALSTVLREEGPRALYKGWLPSVIGVVSNIFKLSFLFIKMIMFL